MRKSILHFGARLCTQEGLTALHYAAFAGSEEAARASVSSCDSRVKGKDVETDPIFAL